MASKGQVTIFIIVALVIVVGIVAYFLLRTPYTSSVPANMKPIYDYYLTCLQQQAKQGISLLGEQGGYIEVPNFVPGSQYMPFSSQLDFFGQPVPYWMYVSGNNILSEQVPSKSSMQEQLNNYVSGRLSYCDFSSFNQQGYAVSVGKGNVISTINSLGVDLDIRAPITITYNNQSATISEQKISVASKLGRFYDLAIQTYNYEKQNMFLENYGVDTLRLYAPVDGVEVSCAPKVFNFAQIKQDIQNALAENFGMLKLKGSYYTLSSKSNQYFVTDIGKNVDENVNFIYNTNMPTKVEIYGDDVAQPVGLQEGLGLLGFCYVPYHLIYDIDFPVLVQFYDNTQVFQFSMAVVIDKNQARNAIPGEASGSSVSNLCDYMNQNVSVSTYDSQLKPVEADIRFKCLNSECSVGGTKTNGNTASLDAKTPKCVNGFLVASAPGYSDSKFQISTNTETQANIIMSKLYNLSLSVTGPRQAGSVLLMFSSENYQTTIVYPDQKSIQLVEGQYNITAYVYQNSTLQLPAQNQKKCVQVPESGIGALIGSTQEQCFDMSIPAQTVDYAIVGGGKSQDYIAESQLKNSGNLSVGVTMFKIPGSLQDVQDNYNSIENSNVNLEFK